MKPSIKLSRDGKRIQIFIPARLGRHSGRKTILSPTGQPGNPDRNTEADAAQIAIDVEITSPSYASRILRLVLLPPPDIQETILNSTHLGTLTLADLSVANSYYW